MGCARHCAVQLPDEGAIDEEHVKITYDYPDGQVDKDNAEKSFWIKNLSRHAILVNDTVLTRKKTAELKHGDAMLIGDNRISVHIHKGIFMIKFYNLTKCLQNISVHLHTKVHSQNSVNSL